MTQGISSPDTAQPNSPSLELITSRHFTTWLAEQQISLGFTTYQSGKLFLLGLQPDSRLSIFERTFNRCLGLWSDSQTLWMSSLYQLWRFENVLEPEQLANGYDRVYVPKLGYVTGDLDIHDIAVDRDGRAVFVNTLFGCLATTSDRYSFTPLWKPGFISRFAPEDRCHLNGLAMRDGLPKYVTAVSQSDVADGWRDRRHDGGCVIDVETNEVIAAELSMPHSPRFYREKLWLLNSGTGFLGTVDLRTGRFEPLTFCPGYLRGISFVGDYAVIGSSLQRENRTFSGLKLDENLQSRQAEPRCGLYVIDLRTGDIVHWLRIEGVVRELYDVVVLRNTRRPMAIGFKSDEIHRMISVGPQSVT
jgi:uncharacterized protein (TIGR03032 family)